MGVVIAKVCDAQSVLDWLIHHYGDDIGKFIAIEKVKQFLETKVADLKTLLTTQSSKIQNTLLSQISSKRTSISDLFNKYKSDIDRIVPGGIHSLEKLKGQSIQDILGVNAFLQKLDQLKNTVDSKINQERTKAFNFIDKTHKEQRDILTNQRPKVPLYDALPSRQQRTVFQEGEKVFSQQIQQNKDTIMRAIGDKLNSETYLKNFSNIIPMSSLDGILGNATNKFDSVKKMVTSGGGISGLAQGIKSIF